MDRDLGLLANCQFDLLVVGGGIYGLFTAWDAALRGLSVALVDRGDFAHATSFNSLRVIHGGLRYLQHGDLRRLRESIGDRSAMLRIAPHLVHPMPFMVPTYGHGARGKQALSLALGVHDALGFDRNRCVDSTNRLPASRIISRAECLRLIPGIPQDRLTGAAVYYDAQMSSSERLAVAVLRSAVDAGAVVANYVEVTGPLTQGNRVVGVNARDHLTGDGLEIRSRIVVNATGPWVTRVSQLLNGGKPDLHTAWSKAFNLQVRRPLARGHGFGVYSKRDFNDPDSIIKKGSRLICILPWQPGSLVGTQHLPYQGEPEDLQITEEEIESFIQEINDAYPPARLQRGDVCRVWGGLLPAVEGHSGYVQLRKRHLLYDHREVGVEGLVSVVGVKFTESRSVAEKTVDLVFRKLGRRPGACVTAATHVWGGEASPINLLPLEEPVGQGGCEPETLRRLIHRYGAGYREVLQAAQGERHPDSGDLDQAALLRAEIVHGIRYEMARKLGDVVFRRVDLAAYDVPWEDARRTCAAVMSQELGWGEARTRRELDELQDMAQGRGAAALGAAS